MLSSKAFAALAIAGVALATVAPAQAAPPSAGTQATDYFCKDAIGGGNITGVGASFAINAHRNVGIPVYNDLCGEGVVKYDGGGSGAGKTAAVRHSHLLAGSDEPLDPVLYSQAVLDLGTTEAPSPGTRQNALHHIPFAVGAVTVSTNLASCGVGREDLMLTSPMLAGLFGGTITNWSDPILRALGNNEDLEDCNKAVIPAVRSDNSGTTYAFKDYLSKRNPQFQIYKADPFNTQWPADLLNPPQAGNGNGGVAGIVKTTDGAIGYVELSTAKSNGLAWQLVEDATGAYNGPDDGKAANCAASTLVASHPASTLDPLWNAVSMTDTPGPYAICTFTYLLTFNNLQTAFPTSSAPDRHTLVDYIGALLSDEAQAELPNKGYGALGAHTLLVARNALLTIDPNS